MISIAMCTCNGAVFLQEQLDSLRGQIHLPKELVICDDASEDNTFSILQSFADEAPFPVKIYRNDSRLGIGANFEKAIGLCSGEVIALCDQDDVWLPEKLAIFSEAFAGGAEWVCCDAEVVGVELSSLGYSLWERVNFSKWERRLARQGMFFDVLLKHYVVAGATLAFRADLRGLLLPFPPDWHYDAWLAAILAATSKMVLVEAPLQCYRQHSDNALGGVSRSLFSEAKVALSLDRVTHCQGEVARWSRLGERLKGVVSEDVETHLDEKLSHLKRRVALPVNRFARIPAVALEVTCGGYARNERNSGSIAIDLLLR